MKRKILAMTALVGFFMMLMFAMGCPTSMRITEDNLPQTPQDKADYFMGYYMAQKVDYNTRLSLATEMNEEGELVWLPTTSKVERAVLKAKYRFIQEADDPITLYDTYVNSGGVPTTQMEIAVNSLISRLEEELIKAGGN